MANCKINNLQYSHQNPRKKQDESEKNENKTWQKVKTRRARRHKRNNTHVRDIHRDRAKEDNDRHDERIHRAGEKMVSNSRNHSSRPPQTPITNKPQRTSYHTKKRTNRNGRNKMEKSQIKRHENREKIAISDSRYHESRSPERPSMKRADRYDGTPDTRFRRDGQPRRSDDH